MAKEGKPKRKKVIENIIKTHCDEKTVKGVADAFLLAVDDIHDQRDIERCDHLIQEILFIAVVAVMCGSESHRDRETFAKTQAEWLKQFIKLEHGAPSHDTFLRVLECLKPGYLDEAVRDMLHQLNWDDKGKQIAIDGKVLCGCYNIKGMSLLRTVSAWPCLLIGGKRHLVGPSRDEKRRRQRCRGIQRDSHPDRHVGY